MDSSLSYHTKVCTSFLFLFSSIFYLNRRDSKKNEQFITSYVRTIHELFGKYAIFLYPNRNMKVGIERPNPMTDFLHFRSLPVGTGHQNH